MTSRPETTAFTFTRAGSLDPNPTLLRQRASAALSGLPSGTTFVLIREGAGLAHYVVMPGQGAPFGTVLELAKTVAARADEAEAPDLSGTRAVAYLTHERGSIPGSNPAVSADLRAVADVAATSLRDGEWIAFSIRRPTRAETKRNKRWLEHRSVHTHHSLEVSAVVTSMWVGGDDAASASGTLMRIAGAVPGFDLRTRSKQLSARGQVLASFAAAAICGGAAYAGIALGVELPTPALIGGAIGSVVLGGLLAGGVIPSVVTKVRRTLASGLMPDPSARLLAPRQPRRAGSKSDGTIVPEFDGDYPLHPSSFLVSAIIPVSLVAPHAGAASGASSTKSRVAPASVREPIGPYLGDNDDQPVFLSAADQWSGFMALGEAGSGKSALLQAMWGYDAAVKAGHLDSHGGPGSFHTMIAFDTKGDGASADEYQRWSGAADGKVLRFDFSDQTSELGIELFPDTGDLLTRSRRVVSALRYVFGEQSIGPESFSTLQRVFSGAFAATPDVVAQVPGLEPGRSPFFYANVLLSSRGDDIGVQLAEAIRAKAERTGDTDCVEASSQLNPLYEPSVSLARRAALVKAPQNKIEQLLAAEHWWSRPKRASWKSLLERNTSVVINLGAANGYLADDDLSEQVAALMMFTLADEMKRTCIGWFESGRQVSVYADELKHLAGTNASVVSWLRNDARSFGARGVFATQFPQQLTSEVRQTVMGFGTLVCFAQGDSDIASSVASSLAADGSAWTSADIIGLQQYEAAVRTVVAQTRQPAFTVTVPNFRALRGPEFLTAQGGDAAMSSRPAGDVTGGAGITFATLPREA